MTQANAIEKVGILIVGAGPTGLGAASRLTQHGYQNWLLIDKNDEAGGLACTAETAEGFLFDMGGHVIFSHYVYFDELLDAALGAGPEAWNTHERVSYVWIKNTWVAYPFQNNIAMLPKEDQVNCLNGLVEAKVRNSVATTQPKNFDEWILRCMGSGIADIFMRPYNFKVWAVPTTMMQCGWLGERVATVNIERAINNVIEQKEDAGWGPNAVFRFPTAGGTGAIWKTVANKVIPASKQRYGRQNEVVALDIERKCATLRNGHQIIYEALLSTIPLDVTLSMVGKSKLAEGLMYSSSHIVGIGIRGTCPHGKKCWLYYPEDDCPFYRTTVFSNYAKKNCPDDNVILPTVCQGDGGQPSNSDGRPGPYWSLMFEISESKYKPVNQEQIQLGGRAGLFPKGQYQQNQLKVAMKLFPYTTLD
eukprot:TRINITY_DN4925_c0_g1_i3.p1 TRINITY_DN4925_c0_g1~~TRINITY_DN4925_c0_g1_i3.p1  ORF type:complete len:419 (-),score=29.60 TRINITY_DN4925_c0_g1_i3:68-1324(-)